MRHNLTADTATAGPLDLNKDGRVTIGELIAGTFLIGALVFLASQVVYVAIAVFMLHLKTGIVTSWWFRWWLPPWLVISAAVTAYVGIRRMFYPERDEADKLLVRNRVWSLEDEDRSTRGALMDETTRIDQADLDLAAWEIMRAYYNGKPWQRGKIEGVSDVRWNRVNELMQKRNIRKGRSPRLEPETLDAAWRLWVTAKSKASSFVMQSGNLREAE